MKILKFKERFSLAIALKERRDRIEADMGFFEASILHHICIVLSLIWVLSSFNCCHPVVYFISLIYLYLVSNVHKCVSTHTHTYIQTYGVQVWILLIVFFGFNCEIE